MPRRRSSPPWFGCILVFLLFAAGGVILVWLAVKIPDQAQATFGAPDPGLSLLQRLRISFDLTLHADELVRTGPGADSPAVFEITPGEDAASVASHLAQQGLVGNPNLLREYLVYKGFDTRLRAGKYRLDPSASAVDLVQELVNPNLRDVDFGILPGWRLEEIAASLPSSGLAVSSAEFLQAAHNQELAPALKPELPAGASLEGFLAPGTYTLDRNISTGELLNQMTVTFLAQITPEMRKAFQNQGLSLFQAVTLASIVQKEAVVEDEQPVIASVFLNRLSKSMKLESDPTVQYALGYNTGQQTWWTNPLSQANLQVDSPYNTYANPGLPPGPIDSPGLPALKAVAFPAKTQYYYFRARCDGSKRHNFATTLDEQISNACQ